METDFVIWQSEDIFFILVIAIVIVNVFVIVQHLDDADHLKSFLIMPKKNCILIQFF